MKDLIIKIIEAIVSFFKSNNKKSDSDNLSDVLSKEAASKSVQLLQKHGKYLAGLTEAQKNYAIKIAFLKSVINLEELTFDELKEFRKAASEAMELGIDVTSEINSFWTDFSEAVKSILGVAADVGVRSVATAIKILL